MLNYDHYHDCVEHITCTEGLQTLKYLLCRDAWEQTLAGNIITHEDVEPIEKEIRTKEETLCADEFRAKA